MEISNRLIQNITLFAPLAFLPIVAESKTEGKTGNDDRPNVIIILTDDQGYADAGFNGGTEIPTPNMDRIAKNGIVFTRGYVTGSVCGPSRAGLITGRYQDRFGFNRNPLLTPKDPSEGLPLSEETLADVLGREGYTSSIIGKWHLGAHPSQYPLQRGFDEFFGFLSGGHNYFPKEYTLRDVSEVTYQWDGYRTRLMRNNGRVDEAAYLTDALSREAVDFIERNAHEPFFLYLSYNGLHTWHSSLLDPVFLGLMREAEYDQKHPDRWFMVSPFSPDTTQPVVPDGYQLIWNDEFDAGEEPDATWWSHENGFVRNNELQWYQPDNAIVKDHLLVIEGRREKVKNPSYDATSNNWKLSRPYAEYTSSSINTREKFSFQYGIIEVRARIDTSMGSWPAIWTLGDERRWPHKGEIDIMEFYRVEDKPTILANAAWGNSQNNQPLWDASHTPLKDLLYAMPDWEERFHIWKMDWNEDYIRLYLNDVLLNEIEVEKATREDGFNPFRQPHYILLNLALGSNGGDPSKTSFPLFYEVDYVRIFQKE